MNELPLPIATTETPQEYVSDVSFDAMSLSPELRKAIAERGYTHPTPVQAKAYGPVLAGRDLIVRSKTGTGKTAAFGMPVIDRIPAGARQMKALVLCPTRELAMQVSAELQLLAKYRNITVTTIYGGASMKQQEDALKAGAAIIVGTPGRVADHIRRGNMKLDACTHVVLDEADEMLNQGFYEEVTRILDLLPKERQVLLFSATVPQDIQRLIAKYTTNAETLLLSGDVFTVDHIRHLRYDLTDAFPKPRNLLYVLEMEAPDNAIVFCNTRDDTELVTAVLNRNGFDAELLNGDLPQKERERVMARIKRGEVAFMVATDLAARGIDISDLGWVINYSLPEDPAVYLHRVGRTGRIGKKGTAINLISGRELMSLATLEKKYAINFETKAMPTAEESMNRWTERHVRDLKDAMHGSVYEGYLGLAQQLKNRPDADELIAFMLKSFFARQRIERAQQDGDSSTAEKPVAKFEKRRDEKPSRESKPNRREREYAKDESRGGAHSAQTRPGGSAAVSRTGAASNDKAIFEAMQQQAASAPAESATPAQATTKVDRPPRREKTAPVGGQKLSDREMFELIQAGKPLPVIADPTVADGGDAPAGEARPRRERPERKRREKTEEIQVAEGQSRLWLNLGKADGVDEGTLSTALEALGAPVSKLKKLELRGTYSYLHVEDADVSAFEALGGKSHGAKALKLERARKS